MKNYPWLIVGSTAFIATALHAATPREASPLTEQEIVAARQAGMSLSASTLRAIYAGKDDDASVTQFSFQADALAKWAVVLPTLFGRGTSDAASNAKPNVWTDRAGFDVRSMEFQAATTSLAATARADDKAEFNAALDRVADSCMSCHNSFRQRPQQAN
jgi:cytochrome c556